MNGKGAIIEKRNDDDIIKQLEREMEKLMNQTDIKTQAAADENRRLETKINDLENKLESAYKFITSLI